MQAFLLFRQKNGAVASGVALGNELITDQAAFEELAHYIDSQEGKVTKCTIGPVAQVATYTERSHSTCTSSGACTAPPDEITITFASTLQITRRGSNPYANRILIDVLAPADHSVSPVAYITTIEVL